MEIKQNDVVGSSVNTQKEKFPVGMIILLILLGFGFVSTLSSIAKPTLQFGPVILNGLPAVLYSLIVLVILSTSFFGVLKRKMWAGRLVIGWYIIGMGISLLNFVSFLADKQSVVRLYQQMSPTNAQFFTESTITGFLTSALVMGVIIGFVVISYVYRRRDFFKN